MTRKSHIHIPGYRRDDDGVTLHYPAYGSTCLRVPERPLAILPHTLTEVTDPAYGRGEVGTHDNDLTLGHRGEPLGERIIVTGRVLDGDGASMQAPHIAVSVFARGLLKRLVTRIYFPDEAQANAQDPTLLSVEDPELRETLVARDERGALRFDIHLQGERQTAFFDV